MASNPVLELMTSADELARAFDATHSQTLGPLQTLVELLGVAPDSLESDEPTPALETCLSALRDGLDRMEACVSQMMQLLYHVDVFLAQPKVQGVSGMDPQEALGHVSELFHTYQSELFTRREALGDLTCLEIGPQDFAQKWSSMAEVQRGRKQTMDDLADLLAGLG
ncbi:hypothetical protein FA10DRAFT_269752 [Acaromyces ingoldii]|uniref:Uncharacterized protein n=1 Tax=Acaromyces ingoldii TaxID=215250 RepID=A0A316YCD3_9BASI|nr:hypothetical protein FA10DRAFT_269752 [Acaromyces ingoldii]PWN87147.1 hypothetical protein FA10DRAFT_269752 [Acaromyces ingoldii]